MSKSYTILSTREYDAFKDVEGNREVRPSHVKKIRTAIEKDTESIKYNPMLVNEKMQVIDGQHRREAIKELVASDVAYANLEYYYVQVPGLTLADVQKLNSVAKQWQPIDYAEAFAKLGNENYQRYLDIKKPGSEYSDLSLNHDSLMRYLSLDNSISSQDFAEGKLKVPDFGQSIVLLRQLREIGEYYERSGLRSFALAFLRIARHPDYDHARMIDRVKRHGTKYLKDYAKEQDYVKALNQVFNYKMHGPYRVTLAPASYFINN